MDYSVKIHHALSPLSFLYGLGVGLRNKFFDWGILPSESYPIPVIVIGNLAVGGTGKTPHVEYLVRLLKNQYRIAVLSRGYKRKTKGYLLANEQSTASEIGDEPYQLKKKFPDIMVAVDANRRNGIKRLLELPEDERPEVLLLDDAFQHRYVQPSLSIVLTDYNRLFFFDRLLPAGRLRERRSAINRADIVVTTKCPENLLPIDMRIIEKRMELFAHQKLFFTKTSYLPIKPVFPEEANTDTLTVQQEAILIAGIAEPSHFIERMKDSFEKTHTFIFPDHHEFKEQDILKIGKTYQSIENSTIITTEKDAARLKNNPFLPDDWKKNIFYLPICIDFYAELSASFDEAIKEHITNFRYTHK